MRRTNFTQQLIRKKVYGAKSNANISALSAKKHLSYHTLSGHTNSAAHMKKAEWQFHGSTVGSTPSASTSSKAAPKEPNCPPCVPGGDGGYGGRGMPSWTQEDWVEIAEKMLSGASLATKLSLMNTSR